MLSFYKEDKSSAFCEVVSKANFSKYDMEGCLCCQDEGVQMQCLNKCPSCCGGPLFAKLPQHIKDKVFTHNPTKETLPLRALSKQTNRNLMWKIRRVSPKATSLHTLQQLSSNFPNLECLDVVPKVRFRGKLSLVEWFQSGTKKGKWYRGKWTKNLDVKQAKKQKENKENEGELFAHVSTMFPNLKRLVVTEFGSQIKRLRPQQPCEVVVIRSVRLCVSTAEEWVETIDGCNENVRGLTMDIRECEWCMAVEGSYNQMAALFFSYLTMQNRRITIETDRTCINDIQLLCNAPNIELHWAYTSSHPIDLKFIAQLASKGSLKTLNIWDVNCLRACWFDLNQEDIDMINRIDNIIISGMANIQSAVMLLTMVIQGVQNIKGLDLRFPKDPNMDDIIDKLQRLLGRTSELHKLELRFWDPQDISVLLHQITYSTSLVSLTIQPRFQTQYRRVEPKPYMLRSIDFLQNLVKLERLSLCNLDFEAFLEGRKYIKNLKCLLSLELSGRGDATKYRVATYQPVLEQFERECKVLYPRLVALNIRFTFV
eukprot:TRINITY_DN4199_c0_g1_i1.p1 TRINITY_DN4199_c0_g1~~TRINITY_DN4199_c0_g1_i1.p1  ORF type:complete len:541 (-),score=42.31 TRINITY_DN4199_c0_g1_i1:1145-2767(-)